MELINVMSVAANEVTRQERPVYHLVRFRVDRAVTDFLLKVLSLDRIRSFFRGDRENQP